MLKKTLVGSSLQIGFRAGQSKAALARR